MHDWEGSFPAEKDDAATSELTETAAGRPEVGRGDDSLTTLVRTVASLVDGILNVNKAAGWTSFDVVAFVRAGSGTKKVGHAGTLDPMAIGVLPVCLGQATRTVEYLMDAHKTYVARVRLGVETDTYDAEGRVLANVDASDVAVGDVEAALRAFRGEIEQRPPPFSAIKKDGVPLYKLARAGRKVEPEARGVTVYDIQILGFAPSLLTLEVECGKGTYIRSLAHDLGEALGVGASLEALTRTRVGPFSIEAAVDLETLRAEFASGAWSGRLLAPDEALLHWPAAILGEENSEALRHGRPPTIETSTGAGEAPRRCRAYTTAGDFAAVLRAEGKAWRPEKVFNSSGA